MKVKYIGYCRYNVWQEDIKQCLNTMGELHTHTHTHKLDDVVMVDALMIPSINQSARKESNATGGCFFFFPFSC